MFARAESGAVIGIEAHPVVAEAHRGNGLPKTSLIGLARGAVRESLVRVASAMHALNIRLPKVNRVINLLPAELPKEGSALDLALAVAILAADSKVPLISMQGRRFFGELSLGAGLEPTRGAVLVAELSRVARGDSEIILPRADADAAAIIPGIRVIGATDLGEVIEHLKGEQTIEPARPPANDEVASHPCLSEVRGQERAKRALEVAAAGGHNLLMVGPPGAGKTMLARRLAGILPELSAEESIAVTRMHSAAGLLRKGGGLLRARPFRAPHHTASEAALCGGGSIPRPGEVTLAHRGVLFLDELPEFSRRALESLREPLEEGSIHVARASLSLRFPARVLLVAAMNPCPCGRFRGDIPEPARPGTGSTPCLCSFEQVQRYRSRISGPLLDRIDMHVLVDALPYRDYAEGPQGQPSHCVRQRVVAARARQTARLGANRTNSIMDEAELRAAVHVDSHGAELIERAIDLCGLSTRGITRIRKVARTIADLEEADAVQPEHLREAIGLRLLDRDLGCSGSGLAA